MSLDVESELRAVLVKLEPAKRQQVLDYARSLQDHGAFPKRSFLDLVGTISKEDLQIMREVIQDDFGTVHGTR